MKHLCKFHFVKFVVSLVYFIQILFFFNLLKVSPITFIVTFRGDHRSVRVEFVPNPRPTKPNRVKNFQTRYRLVRDSGRIRWFFAERWSGLSWGRIWPKLTGSSRKLGRSGRNSIDLVEILRIWPKTSLL